MQISQRTLFNQFLAKRGAKVRIFIFIFQIFFEVFFDLFFSEVLSERLQDIRLDLPTSSLGISISGFLRPLSSCQHRISLDCGCKSTAVKHILQMFLQLFSIYFLLSLIVNDLQMHFSPFFWLPLFLIYFPFPNSQFSILLSQLTKSRRVFIISRRLFSKRRRLFLFLCLSFQIK